MKRDKEPCLFLNIGLFLVQVLCNLQICGVSYLSALVKQSVRCTPKWELCLSSVVYQVRLIPRFIPREMLMLPRVSPICGQGGGRHTAGQSWYGSFTHTELVASDEQRRCLKRVEFTLGKHSSFKIPWKSAF